MTARSTLPGARYLNSLTVIAADNLIGRVVHSLPLLGKGLLKEPCFRPRTEMGRANKNRCRVERPASPQGGDPVGHDLSSGERRGRAFRFLQLRKMIGAGNRLRQYCIRPIIWHECWRLRPRFFDYGVLEPFVAQVRMLGHNQLEPGGILSCEAP